MLCYGFPHKPHLQCYGFPIHGPSCTRWLMQYTQYITQIYASPHSTEHDMLPTAFLISKKAIPYQTRGGTCCSGVSTPKIRSLAYSSTTCHYGINRLHPFNHCSNHSIDPHTTKSHHDGWKTKLLYRQKPKFNITKDERLA
jgi:hypothetical protein